MSSGEENGGDIAMVEVDEDSRATFLTAKQERRP